MSNKSKNERFAVAVDYLFQEKLITSQKDLCVKIGLTEPTYSRIKTGKRIVSDETVRKLNDAFGGIFNMAYFRGDSETLLTNGREPDQELPATAIDTGSILNALLAAKDETIAALQDQLAAKEEIIQVKDELIATLRGQLAAINYEKEIEKLGGYPRDRMASEPQLTPNR
jgi:transcriptional regulator with XRE-family HTH domain